MKKYLFLFVLAIIVSAISSCSKDVQEVEVVDVETVAMEDLKTDLTNLNEAMFNESVVATKARWWKFLVTAVVDAGAGFLTGNVSIGISASSLTWTLLKDVGGLRKDKASLNSTSVSLSNLQLENDSELSDGEVHNIVLVNLYEKYGEEMFSLPQEALIQEVACEVAQLKGCSPTDAISDINMASTEIKIFTEAYVNSSSLEEYTAVLKRHYPAKVAEIDVLEITFAGFQHVDVETDNGKYAREVTKIIDDSSVPVEVKENLKSGVSIANASSRLWNQSAILTE